MSSKKQVTFAEFHSEILLPIDTNNNSLENSIVVQKFSIKSPQIISNLQSKRPPIKPNDNNTKVKYSTLPRIDHDKQEIIHPIVVNTKTNQKIILNRSESLNGTINSKQILPELHTNENEKKIIENQETLDLLTKIKESPTAASIGPMPLSQQACRFELPFDLKLLETFTPLDYLSKYCRLSPRRKNQFKRLFDKYRNRQYRFESGYLYLSIIDIHKENFTHKKFDYLCQLIDLGKQQYQFTFDTYAGILALCERVVFKSLTLYNGYDEDYLKKDTLEKCDFYSLNRKLDGLNVSDAMKRLLNEL